MHVQINNIKIMKKIITTIAIVLFLGQLQLSSQENFPSLVDVNSLRTYIPIDSSMIQDINAKYGNALSLVDMLVLDDVMYLVMHEYAFLEGGFVMAVSIETGEELWKQYIGWRKQGYGLVFNKIKEHDNNLLLTGFRFVDTGCLFDYYELDISNGEITSHMNVDDFTVKDYRGGCSQDFNFVGDDFFERYSIGNNGRITTERYDLASRKIYENVLDLNLDPNYVTKSSKETVDGGFLHLKGHSDFAQDSTLIDSFRMLDRFVITLDESMLFKDSFRLESDDLPYSLDLRQLDTVAGKMAILCADNVYPDRSEMESAIIIMDIEGQITHTFDLGVTGRDDLSIAYYKEKDTYIISRVDNTEHTVTIYNTKGTDEVIEARKFDIIDAPGGTNIFRMEVTDEELIFWLFGTEGSKLICWIMDIEDEDLILDVDEVIEDDLVIYPNPVASSLIVKGVDFNIDFRIYDMVGQLVKVGKIDAHKSINVETLSEGIYIIKFGLNSSPLKFIKL